MNPDELAAAGRALYGEQWQVPLGVAVDVTDRAMRRYLRNERPIPVRVKRKVHNILVQRFQEIGLLIGYLVDSTNHSVLHCPTNALFRYDDAGNLSLVHPGMAAWDDVPKVTEGAEEAIRHERERDKELAERFIRESAWWLTHSSNRPVRAPRHAERLYNSRHGWAVDFGVNTFLVGKAIERCIRVLDRCCDETAAGQVLSRSDVEAKLKCVIRGAVANSNGQEYQGLYPAKNDMMEFGAQGIGVDDSVRFMLAESNLRWHGDALATPEPAPPAVNEALAKEEPPFNPVFLKKVDELQLTVRLYNSLKNENIVRIGDLVQKTQGELLRTPNFGRKLLNEVVEVLAKIGLRLGMEVPGWPVENIDEFAGQFEKSY
jgi:hypothetical protein